MNRPGYELVYYQPCQTGFILLSQIAGKFFTTDSRGGFMINHHSRRTFLKTMSAASLASLFPVTGFSQDLASTNIKRASHHHRPA